MSPTIIVALEQGTAERVARIGGQLGKDLGARVVLAPVRADPAVFNWRTVREWGRQSTTRRGDQEILHRARGVLPDGVEADERVGLGIPVAQLTELAAEVDAALVVMGTRGRGTLASALLGSVSQALARQAPCPVMIVPQSERVDGAPRPGERTRERGAIIAGVDASTQSSAATAFARKLAKTLGHRLLIVHPNDRAGPPARSLQAIAAGEKARLIVIGADNHRGLRLPLSVSLAAQLPRLAPCPVIVVPEGTTAMLAKAGERETLRVA